MVDMYVYFFNQYNYSMSVFYPLFHTKKFEKEEYEEICRDAVAKAFDVLSEKNGTQYILTKDILDCARNILVKEYGFVVKDIFCFDVDDKIVDAYNVL